MRWAILCAVVACTATASAHHSFGVAFDATKTVTLTGVITKIAWTNPHTHVWVDVTYLDQEEFDRLVAARKTRK